MIDAHLSTLAITSELTSVVQDISVAVKRDMQLIQMYEARLRGPLLATVADNLVSKELRELRQTGSHGRNWKNLVNQMDIGIGEYAIEVFEI